MKQDHLDVLRQIAEVAITKAGFGFQRMTADGCNLKNHILRIDIGHIYYDYNVRTAKWCIVGKKDHVCGKLTQGMGISNALVSAKNRKEMHKPVLLAKKLDAKRAKQYKKETPANLLFKLKQAEKYFNEGNSASKAARMAKADYRAVKAHLLENKLIKR